MNKSQETTTTTTTTMTELDAGYLINRLMEWPHDQPVIIQLPDGSRHTCHYNDADLKDTSEKQFVIHCDE